MRTLGRSLGSCGRHAYSLPHHIRDEILSAACMQFVAHADIRAPVSSVVGCSDATPSRAGVVEAEVSQDLASSLYDYAEHKGTYVRLDWGPDHFDIHPWSHAAPTEPLQQVLAGVPCAPPPIVFFEFLSSGRA